MASNYCVKIRSSGFTCAKIKSANGKITLQEHKEFNDTESLKNFIQTKENINFLLFEDRFLSSSISIKRDITDRSAVNSMIFSKLQKEYSQIDVIRFKSSIIEDNPKKDTIKYAINGLYQDSDSYNTFNKLKTFENCNLISLENYALYSFAKEALSGKSFISVWADEVSLTIVAGTQNELMFSRNEKIEESSGSIAQEIAKNIIFAKQKVRDVKFDTLILNGSIFEDESIFRVVYDQTKLPISSFFPEKTKYKKFSAKDFNKHLLEIGSLYIDYTLDFTSRSIKSHIQYNFLLKLYMPILVLILAYFGNSALENYSKYTKSKTQYDQQFLELTLLYPDLKIDYKNKDSLNNLLNILQTHSNKNLLDQIENIRNSINIVNNSDVGLYLKQDLENFIWKTGGVSTLTFSTEKTFSNLNELNQFKANISRLEEKLKTNVKIESTYNLTTLSSQLTSVFYGVSK